MKVDEFKSCVQGAQNREEITDCIKDFDTVYGDIISKLAKSVPEEQYEFEDLFGEWLGLV